LPVAAVLRPAQTRRRHRRTAAKIDGCIDFEGRLFACVITDVSASGAQLLADVPPELEDVHLEIEAFDSFDCRIVWRTDTRVGLEFTHDVAEVSRRLQALLAG
jgi:hypothetical protein